MQQMPAAATDDSNSLATTWSKNMAFVFLYKCVRKLIACALQGVQAKPYITSW